MLGLLWLNLMVSILHPKSFVEYYFVNFIYKIYKDFQHTFCTVSIILPAFYTEVVKVWLILRPFIQTKFNLIMVFYEIVLVFFFCFLPFNPFESKLNPKLKLMFCNDEQLSEIIWIRRGFANSIKNVTLGRIVYAPAITAFDAWIYSS